jgi:hypothetical protein
MRLWLAVFGAPGAWAVQHVVGYALTEATCGEARLHTHMDTWTAVLTGAAALVAIASGVAAVLTFRATRDAGTEPPAGRVRFLSVIGIAITPLFLAMILMSGLGSVILHPCTQG